MAKFINGQRLAGLFVYEKDGRRGMNGRVELGGALLVRPGSSVIVAPRRDPSENGPKYDLILLPPEEGSAANNDSGGAVGGDDDIPF